MSRYYAIIFLFLLALHWFFESISEAVNLTIVGHCKVWKSIVYPSFFNKFLVTNIVGGELLKDHSTHPQVLVKTGVDFLFHVGLICFSVYVFQIPNDINLSLLWSIDFFVISLTTIKFYYFKIFKFIEYNHYQERFRCLIDEKE